MTLCKEDSKMHFYDQRDLILLTSIKIDYDGSWTKIGDYGFELMQNGNSYSVLFTASQKDKGEDCQV